MTEGGAKKRIKVEHYCPVTLPVTIQNEYNIWSQKLGLCKCCNNFHINSNFINNHLDYMDECTEALTKIMNRNLIQGLMSQSYFTHAVADNDELKNERDNYYQRRTDQIFIKFEKINNQLEEIELSRLALRYSFIFTILQKHINETLDNNCFLVNLLKMIEQQSQIKLNFFINSFKDIMQRKMDISLAYYPSNTNLQINNAIIKNTVNNAVNIKNKWDLSIFRLIVKKYNDEKNEENSIKLLFECRDLVRYIGEFIHNGINFTHTLPLS